ncbi:unnamed protein product [Orchesella dallaii]|uniref:DNA endonuclease activator Ctp1 C-terminal domain-containing protein n=1 Tax=Orchesella dallaii TaxID=48710 RepID=A0ABP1RWI3_9HEXA
MEGILRTDWNTLFESLLRMNATDIASASSFHTSTSDAQTCPVPQLPNISQELRPKDPLLNLLLNALALKFAELEKDLKIAQALGQSVIPPSELNCHNTIGRSESLHIKAKTDQAQNETDVHAISKGKKLKTFGNYPSSQVRKPSDPGKSRSKSSMRLPAPIADFTRSNQLSKGRVFQQPCSKTVGSALNKEIGVFSTDTTDQISFTQKLIADFDKIPDRRSEPSRFNYKEETIRKKIDRGRLNGWTCSDCEEYYNLLESTISKEEIDRLKNNCSRHRSISHNTNNVPEGFWETTVPSTQDLYAKGYVKIASQPFSSSLGKQMPP